MSLFDSLVNQALDNDAALSPLRIVVEKELLHHDILREMSKADLLSQLTFMGGTCLRACYGSNRLSEDLDFTGGKGFNRENLQQLADILTKQLQTKYGLSIRVDEPKRETGNVDTWKMKIITRPEQKHLPMQRINIDICAVPSYDPKPMLLRNHYGVDMGTSGLIVQVESREEILASKLIAFALRPNRLKNRDLWDIAWLKQQNTSLSIELVLKKIQDHKQTNQHYLSLLKERQQILLNDDSLQKSFVDEMRRFLPVQVVEQTVDKSAFWQYLVTSVSDECNQVIKTLESDGESEQSEFTM